MNVKKHTHGLYEHYFTTKPTELKSNSLMDLSLWPFAIGSILAFFTIGFGDILIYNTGLPAFFFLIGIAGFMLMVIAHFVLFTVGTIYKHGIFKTAKWTIIGSSVIIFYTIGALIGIAGGVVLGTIIFLILMPSHPLLLPFNILGYILVSLWWYDKGLSVLNGEKTPRETVQPEINIAKKLIAKI